MLAILILVQDDGAKATVLSPHAGDALCPFKDVYETDGACILNRKWFYEPKYAHCGEHGVGYLGWLMGSDNDQGI